ncbi:MAG: CoA pyrophosphatase [Thermoproteota archaeon]|nr:CoA pyrophosphatase [Thermoproteota archaeon]
MVTYHQFHENVSKRFSLKAVENLAGLNMDYRSYSGVLVIIHFSDKIPEVILTRRSRYLNNHAGEISFPGGRFSHADTSLLDTALRETFEEIGLVVNKESVVGSLEPTYTYTSGILIYPYLAIMDAIEKDLRPNCEVDRIISISVDKLMNSITEDQEHSLKNYRMFKIIIDDYVIWGATARILKNLFDKMVP